MGKMQTKKLYRPLKIAKDYSVSVDKFRVNKGALYGRVEPNIYIMVTNFNQFHDKNKNVYSAYRLDMRIGKGWTPFHLTSKNFAYSYVCKLVKSLRLTGVAEPFSCEMGVPKTRKAPQPHTRVFKQAMIDGRGYSNKWEENYYEPVCESTNAPYTGNLIKYHNAKPIATFSFFEGYPGSDGTIQHDGMKVKQIKCRPGKPFVVDTTPKTSK